MFTGIIEKTARVVKIEKENSNYHFTLTVDFANELNIDQSMAHDGCCLTVVKVDREKKEYVVTAMDETMLKTNLGTWQVGTEVNVERSMRMDGRFDGHIVQGHVDQTARCVKVVDDNGSWRFVNDVPTGIYTIPEISSIGKNEQELTQAKVPYEVGKAFFKGMARAQIAGEPQGMLKILFHRETLQVLGVHCFGYQASEIVHIGQAIMNQPGELNTLKYFVNTTFNYPTMAEAYRVAAYDGLNRLF